MDGILDELLRLEDAKYHALIKCDAAGYEKYVREQLYLIDEPRLKGRASADKLLAFSKQAILNTSLYLNLVSTQPGVFAPASGYTGHGAAAETSNSRRVLAEV